MFPGMTHRLDMHVSQGRISVLTSLTTDCVRW
jgi:hypothetical protein